MEQNTNFSPAHDSLLRHVTNPPEQQCCPLISTIRDSPPVGDDGHLEQGGHVEHAYEEGDGGDVELRAEEDEGGGQGARHRVQQELHRHGQDSCRGCGENISGTYCTSAIMLKN